jgi:hypothetical protein
VGGDDELAAAPDQVDDPGDQGHASAHGQRCLRLVEQVQAVRSEPVQERLAVRAFVQ